MRRAEPEERAEDESELTESWLVHELSHAGDDHALAVVVPCDGNAQPQSSIGCT